MLRRALLFSLAFPLSFAFALGSPPASDRFSLQVSPGYYSGDYGTGTQTELTYLPFIFRWDFSRARLKITVPFVSISSAGNVTFTGSGPGPVAQSSSDSLLLSSTPGSISAAGGALTPAAVPPVPPVVLPAPGGSPSPQAPIKKENVGTTQSGLGDVRLAADFYLLKGTPTRPWVTFSPFVKLATADESEGLGTGENDYGAGLGLVVPLGTRWQGYGDANYQVTGDPPGFDYRNVRKVGAGLGRSLSSRVIWETYYEERNSLLEGVVDQRDVSFGFRVAAGEGGGYALYFFKGLSDSAEDWGASLSLGL